MKYDITNDRFSVYVHINIVNAKQYFGITGQNPYKRWQNGYGYKYSPHFKAAIRKYGWDGFYHIVIVCGCSENFAKYLERLYITHYRTNETEFGYNVTNGGEHFEHTQASKSKMGRKGKNRLLSEETKKKMRESAKTRRRHKHTEEAKRNMSIARKNIMTDDMKKSISANHNPTPIDVYDKEGNYIKSYESAYLASIDMGIDKGQIFHVAKGTRKSAKGYVFKYSNQ